MGKALPTVELAESELSAEEAAAWAELSRSGLLERGVPPPDPMETGGDEYQYDLVVRRGDTEQAIRVTELSMPPELAGLLLLLEQRAEQKAREGHTPADPDTEGA